MKRLKIFWVIILCFFFVNVGDLKSKDETRTWTDHSGRFSVKASLISQDGKTVRLKKSNGKIVSLKKSQLSQSDQDYLNELSENPFEQDEESQTINESGETPKQSGSLFRIEEINDSILMGDRSKEELISNGGQNPGWQYQPSIISSTENQALRPFLLYSDPRIASENVYLNEELFFAQSDQKMAAVSFEINSLRNKSSYIQLCQLESGKSTLFEVPFPFQCCDFSPDGSKIIGLREFESQNGSKRKMILTVLNVSGDSLITELEFLPYKQKDSSSSNNSFDLNKEDIDDVCWTDDSHCMTLKKGSLTLWNLENIQSVYSLSGNWKSLSFSQDRKTFVLETVGGLDCYETLSGKLLGSIPIKSNKIEATAFSPDGQKLGVQNKNSLTVYDLKNGQLICNMMIEQSLIGNRILWTDNQHILISSVLYDLEKEIPLCRYTMPLNQKGVACYQGKIWSILNDYESGKRKSFLFGAVLPHQSAIDFAKKLNVANDFWIYPGTKVRLRLELNGFADEKETETILKERLKETQIEVDSKAKVEILLSYNDTKKEEEISYSQSDSRFPMPLPAISPLRQRELGKMKLKVFEQQIVFSVDQKTIWEYKEATTGPQVVKYDPDKKIEDVFREHNKPNPDFIKYVPIPHYLPKKGKTFNALMNANITVDGIIDSF